MLLSSHSRFDNHEKKKVVKKLEGIRFDFSIVNVNKDIIEIKASLFNDNSDTAYFFPPHAEARYILCVTILHNLRDLVIAVKKIERRKKIK
jgi:hypothetical protein